MTSIHSLVSSSKQQELKKKRSSLILQKPITKQKTQLVKWSKTRLNQIEQGNSLYQITYLQRMVQSQKRNGYSCRSLGALLIDKFLMKGKILERKYDNESVEYKLSFFDQNTGFQGRHNLQDDEMMNFYNRLPYEVINQNNRNIFEENINKPYECLNFLFIDGQLVGIKKKMNFDFLRMMGINEEILEDYIQKEDLLPICRDISKFVKQSEGIFYNSSLINFQGGIFSSQIEIKKFIQSDSSQEISNQYIYFIYNCDRCLLNVNKLERNFLSYFRLQELPLPQQISIHKSRIMKPCLVKPIIHLK
ncbi:unnamed protein product [Paramecium primaurelia]|uniref:Uncharacterized protein n=2 Tax=Paramecium primaurelia TaxID=5886 RepID=A0A8S1JQ95_PARPR|nr:unnamed protein product [Paramecium primaurelia]